MTKIAVLFQYWLSPTASTMLATHAGPVVLPQPGWSEFWHDGVIQVTAASCPLPRSVRNRDDGVLTSAFQSGPLRM